MAVVLKPWTPRSRASIISGRDQPLETFSLPSVASNTRVDLSPAGIGFDLDATKGGNLLEHLQDDFEADAVPAPGKVLNHQHLHSRFRQAGEEADDGFPVAFQAIGHPAENPVRTGFDPMLCQFEGLFQVFGTGSGDDLNASIGDGHHAFNQLAALQVRELVDLAGYGRNDAAHDSVGNRLLQQPLQRGKIELEALVERRIDNGNNAVQRVAGLFIDDF